jgi:spore maturation protein CgeB
MRVTLFCHSLLSDWNHGNAHFLRGVATELASRGHCVRVFEPRDAWSVENLVRDHGEVALEQMRVAYPAIRPRRYDPSTLDLDEALDGSDLVLVHEWNDPALVRKIGEHRARGRYGLLFHDTHHRSVSDPGAMAAFDLSGYDGVLAFGEVIRELYVARGWARRAFTWHEAADIRVFRPGLVRPPAGDVVWVGNWGDDERTRELDEYLLGPVRRLGLRARMHGVRYPDAAREALREAGVDYGGWLANHAVPDTFARFLFTVHVPRRPYAETLPGIPTIRPFEALACGIPLVSAPWSDREGLFRQGIDHWVAKDGADMDRKMRALTEDAGARAELRAEGLATIRERHTCAHRVDELLAIAAAIGVEMPEDERRIAS